MIAALAGGVGAARMLAGLIGAVPARAIAAVVNTGDDLELHGLHISPDLDTVTYTLAGAVNPETGWGLTGETWRTMDALDRYEGQTWFRLGDLDLATHLYRTQRLSEGAGLASVTAEIAAAWGVEVGLLPMSEDPVRTVLTVEGEGELSFQQYFVARRHDVTVESVRFSGAEAATPGPGVLDTLATAEAVVICPSNPIVSIGPILAVPGIAGAVRARRDRTVAVSPIVAGSALKGPADRLMRELGHDASVVGVARIYAPLASVLVIDEADADLAGAVEDQGMRAVVTASVMTSPDVARHLAETTLASVLA
ncbi:MAG TPA: 2-phospho-L-lactate transferase [Acidimicrobiales bacterium]|nr:2-phospho-L-lactate transferase [Acidimicrobiales bacterium]